MGVHCNWEGAKEQSRLHWPKGDVAAYLVGGASKVEPLLARSSRKGVAACILQTGRGGSCSCLKWLSSGKSPGLKNAEEGGELSAQKKITCAMLLWSI